VDQIEIRFFGRLADRVGGAQMLPCGPEGLTVADIRERLGGDVADPERVRAVIADEIAGEDWRVGAGGSVEFLPPLSGG